MGFRIKLERSGLDNRSKITRFKLVLRLRRQLNPEVNDIQNQEIIQKSSNWQITTGRPEMKPFKLAVIVGTIAIAATLTADPTWVEFEPSIKGEAPQLTVFESSIAGTTINLKTLGMWLEDVKEGEETYQRITLPTSYTLEVGKPMLPVVRRLVAIPPTAGVQVKVESKREIVLEDYLEIRPEARPR